MRRRTQQASRNLSGLVAIAAVAAGLVLPTSAGAGPRGCVAADPANAEFPNPCTFRSADANGIYVASGDWELRIRRGDRTILLSSAHGDPATGTLEDGDFATARALSKGSVITVGNPRPDAAAPAPGPEPVPFPAGMHRAPGSVTSFDGTTIAYTLYVPAGADAGHRVPAVIASDGFGGDGSGYDPTYAMDTRYLIGNGYAVLTYAPRGIGGSGGVSELDSYDYEARDISALIDMLAAHDAVLLDRAGDPRVGMIGASYGGAIQLTAAARDHRIDAITPNDTWNNLLTTFLPEGVVRMAWFDYFAAAGIYGNVGVTASSGTLRPVDTRQAQAAAEATATGDWSPTVRDYYASRGPWNVLDRVEAPTLLLHGADDTLFPPSQAAATYKALRARHPRLPLKLQILLGGHGSDCSDGDAPRCSYYRPNRDFNAVFAWLQRWLKRDTTVDTGPAVAYETQDEVLHAARTFPIPAATVRAMSTGGLVVVNGEPDVGGGADPANALPDSGAPILRPATPLGRRQQTGVTTLKVPIDVHAGIVVGTPTVTLSWTGFGGGGDDTGHAPLFFRIVDLRSDTVLNDQETPHVLATDGVAHTATFTLESIAWQAGPSDQLALEISSSSANFEPYRGAAAFLISAIQVRLPVADTRPT
jgi:ABC-2 type transport system ATP-binding protein